MILFVGKKKEVSGVKPSDTGSKRDVVTKIA